MKSIRKDVVIMVLASLGIGFALIFCILKLIDQSDAHVKEITSTRVETSAPNVWKPELNACDKQLEHDISSDSSRVRVLYRNLEFSEVGFKHFAEMKRLQSLRLIDCTVQNGWIKYLVKLPLIELSVAGSEVSSAAASDLSKIKGLEVLELSRCDFDDAGIEPLTHLEHLISLNLSQSRITDRAAAFFPRFKHLDELRVGETAITKDSIPAISTISSLKSLDIHGTKCDTKAISTLKKCKNLARLVLIRCEISDDAVQELSSFSTLDKLNLENNPITDDSLKYFKRMPVLRKLILSGCNKLSVPAIQRLQHELPNCQISYGTGTNAFGF